MQNGTSQSKKGAACKVLWRNRSKRERLLLIGAILALAVLLALAIGYVVLIGEPEVCGSPACVRTSMEILNFVDPRADPCQDFYHFACGNFLQSANPDDRASRSAKNNVAEGIQSQIRNMLEQPEYLEDPPTYNLAKRFYRACMNETAVEAEGLKAMEQVFGVIGGWPTVLGDHWDWDRFDWMQAVHRLRGIGINFEFFLILSVRRDNTGPTRYVLNLADPSYKPSEISESVKQLYLDYMVDLAVLFGAHPSRARDEQKDVMKLLLQLAKISEEAARANGSALYNPFLLSELQHEYPSIRWQEYINKILTPASQITYDDTISVSQPMYLTKLLLLLETTSKRTIANFMAWHTLQHLINFLPAAVLNRAYEYLDKINGEVKRDPRWRMCVGATENRMDSVISAVYVEKYFDEESRRQASSMIRSIRLQFRENLNKLDWLDEKTKSLAAEKIASSVEDIPSVRDLMERSRAYERVEIWEDQLLRSVLSLDYVNTNMDFGKLKEESWIHPALENLGFVTGMSTIYSPRENVLHVPVGIFQGIYYQKDRPQYLNYGGLGSTIAHEMYHVIIEAENTEHPGELRSWWSSHSLLNYEKKLHCLQNGYAKLDQTAASKVTQSSRKQQKKIQTFDQEEDMADLAGMKIAYDTYRNRKDKSEPFLPGLNYTPNQLFWLSAAIRHCSLPSGELLSVRRNVVNSNFAQSVDHLRVNGALRNLDDFAYDFACPVGTHMNPQYKCAVW